MSFREKRILAKLRNAEASQRAVTAADPLVTANVLDHLSADQDIAVRLAVVENRATLETTLYRLGHDPEPRVRKLTLERLFQIHGVPNKESAVSDPSTSPEILAILAEDLPSYSTELREICGNEFEWTTGREVPEARLDVLRALALVRNPAVRAEVAKSRAADRAGVLTVLATDNDEEVRLAVAGNGGTPDAVVEILTRDQSARVRAGTARRTNSATMLRLLAMDPEPSVRTAVAANLHTEDLILVELASDPSTSVRLAIARADKVNEVSGSIYALALQTAEPYQRETPVAALTVLSDDLDPSVRATVAAHPLLPISAFLRLAVDPEKLVRERVASVVKHGYGQRPDGAYIQLEQERYHPSARPLVPPESLAELAAIPDRQLRMAVAQHPEVPASLLARLLDDKAIFDWDQDDRERPWDELTLMPYSVLAKRNWSDDADWGFLATAENPEARTVLTYAYGTPDDVLLRLARDPYERVRSALLSRRDLPAAVLRALIDDPSPEVSRGAVDRLSDRVWSTVDELHLFVDARSAEARAAVGRAPQARAVWLATLARDDDSRVRGAVGSNAETPVESLLLLAEDDDASVIDSLVKLIRSDKVKSPGLAKLSNAGNSRVRAAVAQCKGVSSEILRTLVRDADETVRVAASASGFHAGLALASALLGDAATRSLSLPRGNAAVLVDLAQDQDIGDKALHSLAQSPFEEVRAAVASNASAEPAVLANLSRDTSKTVRAAVASNQHTPPEALAILSQDGSVVTRRNVAANPNTTGPSLGLLAHDLDDVVALAVALHPNTLVESLDAIIDAHPDPVVNPTNMLLLSKVPPLNPALDYLRPDRRALREILQRSANYWQQGARQVIAANPRASLSTLRKLAAQPDTAAFVAANEATPTATLGDLARSGDDVVREAAAMNRNTPSDALAMLGLDPSGGVRLIVAGNHKTPFRTLQILAGDFSSDVADAARATLRPDSLSSPS